GVSSRRQTGSSGLQVAVPGSARGRFGMSILQRFFGFDKAGRPQAPVSGWPVFRYGQAELEVKKQADGEPPATPIADWALRHRFTQPGTHQPFTGYTYAEQAPPDETVP